MRTTDIKYQKAKNFALRIIKLCKFLKEEKHEFEIAGQIIRSGTSIGANIAESQYAESANDFTHKLNISLKEANETRYWLELLHDAEIINYDAFVSLNNDCEELVRILATIVYEKRRNKGKIPLQ